jgi:hypothetical protein
MLEEVREKVKRKGEKRRKKGKTLKRGEFEFQNPPQPSWSLSLFSCKACDTPKICRSLKMRRG